MTSRLARLAGTAVVAAVALTACGGPGSNGEAAKSAQQIVTDAERATAAAASVHLSGAGTVSNAPLSVNVVAGQHRGGGTISTAGAVVNLILDKATFYLKADAATLRQLTGNAGLANSEANRWLQTSSASGAANQSIGGVFASLLDITKLPGSFAFGGVPTKQAVTTFHGTSVIPVTDPQSGGTLYAAATGKPYIIAVKGSRASGGATLTFTDYGQAKVPSAPPNPVPLDNAAG